MLQYFEQTIQYTSRRPAIHARVNGVSVAEALGKSAPFAVVLGDVQDRVDALKVAERDVAVLYRQERFDSSGPPRDDPHVA